MDPTAASVAMAAKTKATMSSQDSSAGAEAAATRHSTSRSMKSSKSTGSNNNKKKRHRQPDRLGWLGGLTLDRPASAPAASNENQSLDVDFDSQHDEFEFGSQSSRDVTPHPMEFSPPETDAVDLTADTDDDDTKQDLTTTNLTDEWECPQCTLLNSSNENHCTVCGHRRGSARKKSRDPRTRRNEAHVKKAKVLRHTEKKESEQQSTKHKSQLSKWSRSSQSTVRRSAEPPNDKPSSKNTSAELWIDKHFPKSSVDLCIAPKKTHEVRQWLYSHVEMRRRTRHAAAAAAAIVSQYEAPPSRLLILVGSPGVGKSTLVRVLARELNVHVLKWNDVSGDYVVNCSSSSGGSEEYVPYQSQLGSFEEFLVGAGAGMDSVLEDESMKEGESGYDGSVILIEEIPNLYNAEAAQSFRIIMEKHIQRSAVPTVLIFSDVYEGKHKPEELERLIPNRLLYSLQVQILPIQPVTKAKMKKSIESIAKAEGLGRLPTEFIEELHLSSGGDLRHAIFALQFQYATKSDLSSDFNTTTKRDVKLSSFHALGKLLYAKRNPKMDDLSDDFPPSPETSKPLTRLARWDDGRGPLEFVPEEVLSRTDMNTGSAIAFLSYHSPDYFTDITELSHAFDHISDAGSFLDKFGPSEGPYPMDYASSLGGRAIADANKTPAPNQFRHLSAPKVFEVMKKSRDNEVKMDQLRKRLSIGSQQISVCENIGSAYRFVTDSLPYLKNIIPQDVNYALANLHSYARESTTNLSQSDHTELVLAQQEQEQQAIFKDDDLVDDDNDDW